MSRDLTGMTTPQGWTLASKVAFPSDHTGGHFSDCYHGERGGDKAFVKVLDISSAKGLNELLANLSSFQYETGLVTFSTQQRMSRVVRLLESGELVADPTNPTEVLRNLPFLVFERGDGDIRESVDVSAKVSNHWRLTILHQTAAGLIQLHRGNIAHQDLKPSNVLRIGDTSLKVADLGRSSRRGAVAPHDTLDVPGALKYAPFELSYSYVLPDWTKRRLATDVFHMGCLTMYVFTNVVFPTEVFARMDPVYRPGKWGDPYPSVIPHIKTAMEEVLADVSVDLPDAFRGDLVPLIRDLCNPDPESRGTAIGSLRNVGTSLWLEKFVSRFAALTKRAAISEKVVHA